MLRLSDQRKQDRRGDVRQVAKPRGVPMRVRLAETKRRVYYFASLTKSFFKGCGGPRLGDRQQERRN